MMCAQQCAKLPLLLFRKYGIMCGMNEDGIVYLSSEETARRWGISDRRVRVLCENGQVEGAVRNGKLWKIPQSAVKPRDGRTMRALGIPVGLCGRIAEIDSLKDRLAAMLAANPGRVDYYKRYMDIIEAYNAEQDRTTIEKTFMDLMDLVKEMSTEEQRYVREGFSSDEELSIYDLLFSDNLSKSDIQKIKRLSVELLKKIKERIAQMDHWTDKDETRATVQNLIRDELYMNIPDSMFDQLDHYREVIYEHVYTHYKEAA